MTDEKRQERQARIEAAAFEVLEEMGYRRTSMLQIAKRARASNETMYSLYQNKQDLFRSIIEKNSAVLKDTLSAIRPHDKSPRDWLQEIGRLLLTFTATEKAIVINRAAVADVSEGGALAETIETFARSELIRLLEHSFSALAEEGRADFEGNPAKAVERYLALLFGELQIQQAFGAVPALSDVEIDVRAKETADLLWRLYPDAKVG